MLGDGGRVGLRRAPSANAGSRQASDTTAGLPREPALARPVPSEGDPKLDVREKLPRYRQAEIPEIWLVDPFEKTVHAERITERGYEASDLASGKLESAVVPGFWIDVSWLWHDDLPSTLACLRDILGE